ncbi:MAG: helix-turn-helix domain-containing GNAT family N-acetyltransferase [Spirochaetes bacterium]|nr:helix-turn-helix domain-containing GNAT family N-acetyltransferase [Spirochaetota bacterium]
MSHPIIESIRKFNRFYTQLIGLLNQQIYKSNYTLTDCRTIFEIGKQPGITAVEICQSLGLDPAYLSRILSQFVKKGIIKKETAQEDKRKQFIFLTPKGKVILDDLENKSNAFNEQLIQPLTQDQQEKLIGSMESIQSLLYQKEQQKGYTFRSYRPGDIGIIISKHAVLYATEYGFDHTFEGFVAETFVDFSKNYDPDKEHFWIVESSTKTVGSIAIVHRDRHTAQLRWFFLDPQARGQGLGSKMMSLAMDFCKTKGYEKVYLSTVSQLKAARYLYKKYGFSLVEEKPVHIWGQDLVDEKWEANIKAL